MSAGPHLHHRQPGDGWVECACGRRHWGLFGAAGLLLARYRPPRTTAGPTSGATPGARPATTPGDLAAVVLQHRAPWSDQGGTWGVPGGARNPDELAVDAALREAAEEAGIDPAAVVVLGTHVLRHPDWSYTTVLAREAAPRSVEPAVTDPESVDVRWVPVDEVAALPLLPAFAEAWPGLRARLAAGG